MNDLIIDIVEDDEGPEYFSPALDGQTVTIKVGGRLSRVNQYGGTDCEDVEHPVEVVVVRHWWDYETGWGFEGVLDGEKVFFREHAL